jgi:predicted amidohydrolase YtcJ
METTLYLGGTVLPCDGSSNTHEALVTKGKHILGVGTGQDMRGLAGTGATVVDLQGATLLPGLIDTHPHAMHFAALRVSMVDLSDVISHADILQRIADRASQVPKGEWIFCTPVGEAHYYLRRSWRDLPERRLPNRWELDAAAPDNPVMIQAWAPSIPNVCAVNSLGLKKLGLSWVTPERVCDVWIERDERGELNGILRGSVTNYYTHDPFWMQIWERLPKAPPILWEIGGEAGMAEMNRLGVTTIYEAHVMDAEQIQAYRTLRVKDKLSCRVLTALEAAPQAFDPHYRPTESELADTLQLAAAMHDVSDDLLRHNGVTLARSGPCWPGFWRGDAPFKNPYGELIYGYEFLPKWVEEQVVDYCLETGLRLNVLACAPRDHTDFFHSCAKHNPHEISKRDWILQHAIMMRPDDVDHYAKLGLSITTSKGFHWGKGDMYGERLGKDIWRDLIPLRRMLDAGLKIGCGTDWGPKNVFEQIQLAITCEFSGSGYRNLAAAQAISAHEALLMWTRDAAAVLGWQGVGSLAPGHHADLTIVDRNPLTCDVEDLASTQVFRTILGGLTVYETGVI